MAKKDEIFSLPGEHHYEIRKEGLTYMSWNHPSCGYSRETLKNMREAGYRLYVDGKLQRI